MPIGKPWTTVFCSSCGRKTYFQRRPEDYSPGIGLWCAGCENYEEDCDCYPIEDD